MEDLACARWRLNRGASEGEDDLILRAGRGDPRAVRELVGEKLPRVLNLARRMLGDPVEAEDVAQETFLRAWKAAATWRPGRARFDTWLHRVTLNLCYDRLRLRRRGGGEPPDRADEGPGPERGLHAADVGRRVEAALAALPARQREAVALVHYQELSGADASALMGVSIEALESLLSRGRRALRAALTDLRDTETRT
jgi:RNA polymerase sigma-70 factor (ECF subfamily)